MYITTFDSKKYLSYEKFMNCYEKRKKYLSVLPQQEEKFKQIFRAQSIRYIFYKRKDWIEEHFESMDGTKLVYYHDALDKHNYQQLIKEILDFYKYDYAGIVENPLFTKEETENYIKEELLFNKDFSYTQDTLIYCEGEDEIYVYITAREENHFYIRAVQRNENEKQKKQQLLEIIEDILNDKIVH